MDPSRCTSTARSPSDRLISKLSEFQSIQDVCSLMLILSAPEHTFVATRNSPAVVHLKGLNHVEGVLLRNLGSVEGNGDHKTRLDQMLGLQLAGLVLELVSLTAWPL